MAVPKRKTSRQKTRSRRAHHQVGKTNLAPCKNCGAFVKPHRICPECGWYKNSVVLPPKVKAADS